jgi:hypothetical protein
VYKFDEMVGHATCQLMEVNAGIISQSTGAFNWTSKDLTHVYFTYMTETSVISLVQVSRHETGESQLILIHNTVQITETEIPPTPETGEVRQADGTIDFPHVNPRGRESLSSGVK